MARGLTVAIWIFCVNCVFTILKSVNPFLTELDFTLGDEMINASAAAGEVSVSALGVAEILMALNLFLDLILGPFRLTPQIMSMIGITGVVNYVLTGAVWMIYSYFIFQLISGKALKDIQ